jgi:hypothetical protein
MRRDEQSTDRGARPDHWVYLDRWWARRLGAKRTVGIYRIRSRELARRLSQEGLAVNAAGTVFAYGSRTRLGSPNRQKWPESAHETAVPEHRARY